MLTTRVIPVMLYKDFGLVKGSRFDSWRPVGSAMQAMRVYGARWVDELILLDIAATQENRPPDDDLIDSLTDKCFLPLTVGGGVRNEEHVRRLLLAGADKVAVNTALVECPYAVEAMAKRFGCQCVVASIDVRADGQTYVRSGIAPTGWCAVTLAKCAVEMGAGEILLTSIDREGTMAGYDVPLIRAVVDAVSVPVIACGGAGTYEHFRQAIQEGGASAVAAGAMWHFTEQTPRGAKVYLKEHGIPVRL